MEIVENNGKKIILQMIMFASVLMFFIYAATDYWQYAMIAKSTVPIMDYWQWIASYGQRVLDGTVTFWDYFNSDLGEHIQPVAMAINFGMLKATNFNVAPMVEWGIAIRIILAAFVIAYFLRSQRSVEKKNYVILLICSVVMIMSIFNYNQWELTIEPFSVGCSFRVTCYLGSFCLIDLFVRKIESRTMKQNSILASLAGLFCAALTLLVGGAYFVGHLVAIGFAMLCVLWQRRDVYKKYFWPMGVWAVISFVSACVYYYLVSMRGASTSQASISLDYVVVLVQSICFFWGGLFIHNNTMEQFGGSLCTLVGAVTLIYTVFILIQYIKKDGMKKNMFPSICVLYALILSVAISAGRLGAFNASYLSASRYTVESSIGLIGIVWMTYSVTAEGNSKRETIGYGMCVCLALVMLLSASRVEKGIAPYRKMYNDNLVTMMINIEDYADDELGAFQANSAEYVRYSVEFFKENQLSIFSE